jgi:putative ABC transport system permease protein
MSRTLAAFATAFANLAAHKLRAALTTIGMMFGVGAVIAMMSIGAGAEHRALALIDRLGTRNLVVRAKPLKPQELVEIRKKSLGLSQRDVDAIREAIDGVEFVAPRVDIEPYAVRAAGATTEARVAGVGDRQREVEPVALAEGRMLDHSDEHHRTQACVIGAAVRRDLFGVGPAVGRDVEIDDAWFEVVGVLAPDPGAATIDGVAVASTDRAIYVPLASALDRLDRDPMKSPLGEIVVRLEAHASPDDVAVGLGALLDRLHGGAKDYDLVVPAALLRHGQQTRQLFDLVMGLIAGISLLVGGIGIVNVMLASVLEQTREIGVRRALGARRRDIRFQFLVTASVLALLGGALGVGLGVGIAHGVAAYAGWPTVVTLSSIVLSLGVSTAVGIASGLYPAVRAARLDPIQALAAP